MPSAALLLCFISGSFSMQKYFQFKIGQACFEIDEPNKSLYPTAINACALYCMWNAMNHEYNKHSTEDIPVRTYTQTESHGTCTQHTAQRIHMEYSNYTNKLTDFVCPKQRNYAYSTHSVHSDRVQCEYTVRKFVWTLFLKYSKGRNTLSKTFSLLKKMKKKTILFLLLLIASAIWFFFLIQLYRPITICFIRWRRETLCNAFILLIIRFTLSLRATLVAVAKRTAGHFWADNNEWWGLRGFQKVSLPFLEMGIWYTVFRIVVFYMQTSTRVHIWWWYQKKIVVVALAIVVVMYCLQNLCLH